MMPALEVEGVSKRFGATVALRDAVLRVRPGEVHALVGENGSGKSTLVKILSGVHLPDQGTLRIGERELSSLRSPRESLEAGVATVFQEVLVAENRTVLENLWLGHDGAFRARVPQRAKRERAEAILAELLVSPPPVDTLLEDLQLSDRQAVAIARALLREPRILILDEATSALDYNTRSRLFDIVRRRSASGTAVILITHRMDEIDEIADTVTVLRSGETVGTIEERSWTSADLVRLMTGAEHLAQPSVREASERRHGGDVVLEVSGLRLAPGKAPIELQLRAGEVVGLAGLEGHGQDAFIKALWGMGGSPGAVIRRDGAKATVISSPESANACGIAYVPRERRAESMFEWMSILDNFALPTIGRDSRGGLLSTKSSESRFLPYIERLRIRLGQPSNPITTLSGGNAQKVVIARWLASEPRILLLNDPTRGIDINAKRDLYRLLAELAEQGLAVVMLSTEVDEHVELMDRVLVFREFELAAQLQHDTLERETLVASFFGEDETR